MNYADFLKYTEFPVSAETYKFIQDTIQLVGQLAHAVGDHVIVSGCAEAGTSVSAGYVAVNGEVLHFAGGTRAPHVIIKQDKVDVQAYSTLYEGLYTTRTVIFGNGPGQLPWSSFVRVRSLASLDAAIKSIGDAFQSHTSNHTVQWNSVSGRPAAYPPESHSHEWMSIINRPQSYNPKPHTHPVSEIQGIPMGEVKYIGVFSESGVAAKIAGSLPPVGVTRMSEGRYIISHNLGHTRYLILGVGTMGNVSINGMTDISENSCTVLASDDASLNDAAIRFVILTY